MKRQAGLTILETLIAIAVLGIAFSALMMSQLSNLGASVRARSVSVVKVDATRVLETLTAAVLKFNKNYDEVLPSGATETRKGYWFTDYAYACPTSSTTAAPSGRTLDPPPTGCSGTDNNAATGNRTDWEVARQPGLLGEGSLLIKVTTSNGKGAAMTLVNRISCYDVYPSPSTTVPLPCPRETPIGGGGPQ